MTKKSEQTVTPVLGFIGMGLMGTPMSKRLLKAGFALNVWNRSSEKTQTLSDAGARLCETPQELAHNSDVIMLCVTDTDAVEHIAFGDQGLASHLTAAKTLIDFSSIAPTATQSFAQRLHRETGAQWIDAPVSGGVVGAEAGTLVVMAGGPEAVIDRLRPVFAALSQRVTRMGEVGSGQATKVCNQMIVSCNVMVIAEVLALAERAGVDSRQIPGALAGGFADSIPLQVTGQRMAQRDLEPVQWHVSTLLKDLTLAASLAQECDAQTPMSELARGLMQKHGEDGYLHKDPATLINCYEQPSSTLNRVDEDSQS